MGTPLETYRSIRSHVSLLMAWIGTSVNTHCFVRHCSGQADFRYDEEGFRLLRNNMNNAITLTFKNFRESVNCEGANGDTMPPVRFINGRDLIAAAYDNGLVGVWDLNMKWLCTVTHPSKVHVIAVSNFELEDNHQFLSSYDCLS